MDSRSTISLGSCAAFAAALLLLVSGPEAVSSQEQSGPFKDAMARARSGDIVGAIGILEALRASGDAPDAALGTLGALHLEAGNAERAMEILAPLAGAPQPDPAALYNAGRTAEALGRFADAGDYYQRSVSLDGFSPALRALGMLLGRLGRPADSYPLLATWVEANPGDHPARIAAAAGALEVERIQEAESLIEGLPRDAPAIQLLRGRILLQRGDAWGALGELQPLANDPPPALEGDVRRTLASTWIEVGDAEAAIEQMELLGELDARDTVQLANAYFHAGRLQEAIDTLGPLAEPLIDSRPPADPPPLAREVLLDYGRYLLSAGDNERAIDFLSFATAVDPSFAESFEALAHAFDASDRGAEAATARGRYEALTAAPPPGVSLSNTVATSTADPTTQALQDALETALSGDTEGALAQLSLQAEQAPADPRPVYVTSSILLRAGRGEEALNAADRALAIAPWQADGLYQRAVVLMALQRLEEAEEMFQKALELMPEHPAALSDYAVLLMSGGRSDEAAGVLERFVELRPGDPRALAMLGRSLLDAQRFSEAQEPLRQAIDLEPRNPAIRLDLASALWEDNRPDEAEQQAREAAKLQPASGPAHRMLGALLLWRGNYLEAATSLERAGQNEAVNADLLLDLARAWQGAADEAENPAERQARLKRGESAYRRAATLAPEHSEIAYGLAQVLQQLGREEEAAMEMNRYRELYERDQNETRESGRQPQDRSGDQ